MRNHGYVVSLREKVAEVVLGGHAECKHCGACLAALDEKRRTLPASNEIGARVGQKVEVEIAPGRAVTAAFVLFILPLVAAFVGGWGGYRLGPGLGLPAAAGGVGFGLAGFVLVFVALRHLEKAGGRESIARIVRIDEDDDSEGVC
jgi:sigma-E factor negative regulatory protein RseC